MKITKFKEVEKYEDKLHKEKVEQELNSIKTQDATNHEQLLSKQKENHDELITKKNELHADLVQKQEFQHNALTASQQTQHNALTASQQAQHEEISADLEILKTTLSGVQPRSDKTRIYNQKIDENFIILETTDILMNPDTSHCSDIFNPATHNYEKNQFFILEENIDPGHCSQRAFSFDTDNKYAFRQDQYSGDSAGFYETYGLKQNNSSDLHITNDTLYKIRVRMDDDPAFLFIEDGDNLSFSDLEIDNAVTFKRDHTISGYTLTYVVEGKRNS